MPKNLLTFERHPITKHLTRNMGKLYMKKEYITNFTKSNKKEIESAMRNYQKRFINAYQVSQFPASSWFDMFSDNTYADACLIRITDRHHTYRLEMNGINMRETD